MACRFLVVVILSIALIGDHCKALTSSSIGPDQQPSIHFGSTQQHQEQEREEICNEQTRTRTAAGEERRVGKQAEFPDVRELQQREVASKGRNSMARTIKAWPDLVGLDVEDAKNKILEEQPNLQVQIVPEGSLMTMDFNPRRVRIHKTKEQKVAQIPKQG